MQAHDNGQPAPSARSWAVEAKSTRETERAATVARLDKLSPKAEARSAFGAAVNAKRLRAQVLALTAPHVTEMVATLDAHAHEAWSPEDEDLTEAQNDDELAAIAQVVGSARHGRQHLASGQPSRGAHRDSRQALQR